MGLLGFFGPNIENMRANRNVEGLIKALRNSSRHVRYNAITALGEIGDARAVESLILALKDEDPWVRRNAVDTLDKIGDARAVGPLILFLKDNDSDSWARRNAVEALYKIGDARAVEPIILALKDADEYVRASAASALARIGDVMAVEPLIQSLEDIVSFVRRDAAEALGELHDKRAVASLVQALEDNETAVRSHAAQALGKIGDVSVAGPLTRILKDDYESPAVRSSAAQALKALGWKPSNRIERIRSLIEGDNWDEIVKIGKPAVATLTNALKTRENPNDRKNAAKALGEVRDSRAVEPLINALRDTDWHVRAAAAEALGRIKDARAIDPLITLLDTGTSELVPEILKLISSLPFERISRTFGRSEIDFSDLGTMMWSNAILDKYTDLVNAYCEAIKNAAGVLGEMGDGRAVESVFQALVRTSRYARSIEEEVWSKRTDGEAHAFQYLMKKLHPGYTPEMREALKEALVKIGKPTATYIVALEDKAKYFSPGAFTSDAFTRMDMHSEEEIQQLLRVLLSEV